FGANEKNHIDLNVVLCHEQWEAVDPDTTQIATQENTHAWISSRPINKLNVHTRCNLGARYRWGIEAGFLVEKHQGFYEWPDVKHHARGLHPFKSGRPGFPRFVHGHSVLPSHTQPVGKGWKTRTPFPGLSIHLIATS
ncbi:MAG: hypothetical protein GY701_27280, partial [Sulfitobacter sp.]|nr:hypothetical protein [Sulfitobacter sp.]